MSSEDNIASVVASSPASSSPWIWSTLTAFAWRLTQLSVVVGSILVTLLYFKQESLLYFPEIGGISRRPDDNPAKYRSPSEHKIPFENVMIPCEDGVHIHAWLMLRTPATNNPLPTLVYFHGNAGNIGLRLPNAIQMMKYLSVNILLVEYRGYGNSDSVTPNEAGLKLDGRAALDFVHKHPKLNKEKIFLFGRSLGGAVAFNLAAYAQQKNIPVAGVIVENTFASIPSMVDHLMPIVAPFKGLILKMKWDSQVIVPTLQCPVLYLAGQADQLVPHSHMVALHQQTQNSKLNQMHVVPNGTHNDTWMKGGEDYWKAFRSFLGNAIDINSKSPTIVPASATSSIDTDSDSTNVAASFSDTAPIPIMPNRLFGMVKEAVHGVQKKKGSTSDPTAKKEI